MKKYLKIFAVALVAILSVSCQNVNDVSVKFSGVSNFKLVSYKEFECTLVADVVNPTIYKASVEDLRLDVTLNGAVLGTVLADPIYVPKKSSSKVAVNTKIYLNDENFSFLELSTILRDVTRHKLLGTGEMTVKVAGMKRKITVKNYDLTNLKKFL